MSLADKLLAASELNFEFTPQYLLTKTHPVKNHETSFYFTAPETAIPANLRTSNSACSRPTHAEFDFTIQCTNLFQSVSR